MTHFLTTPKFDLLLYIGEKCGKNPYFYHFFWKKEVKLERNQKKKLLRASTANHDLFFQISHIWPTFIFGVSNATNTFFFFTFSGKNRSNNKIFGKKNLRASTRSHDPFSDNSKIWPTFIYRGEVRADTFAKLPVHALINDPQKNWYRHQLQPMIHFFTNHKFDLLSYISIINFLNLPVHALIHDLQKKTYGHQLGLMTHFLTTPKFDLLLYIGEKCLHTHLQSFLCAP